MSVYSSVFSFCCILRMSMGLSTTWSKLDRKSNRFLYNIPRLCCAVPGSIPGRFSVSGLVSYSRRVRFHRLSCTSAQSQRRPGKRKRYPVISKNAGRLLTCICWAGSSFFRFLPGSGVVLTFSSSSSCPESRLLEDIAEKASLSLSEITISSYTT